MANEVKYPEGQYKIITVGPVREWSFKGDDGADIKMVSYSIQFEGVAEWVDVSQKPETAAPTVGETLEGHIEDTGKYGFKFVKARKGGGGGWGGGKRDYSGAHYNAAIQTASTIVIGYYQVTGTKPKDVTELLGRIEELTPKVKAMVDTMAGSDKKEESSGEITKESLGEGKPDDKVVIEDVDEKELKW